MRRLLGGALIGLSMLVPSLLLAQRVHGLVTERDRTTPVAGAVVLLLDASGAVAGRALSNDRGEYSVAARAPGTHRLRVLRIGVTPTLTPAFALAADVAKDVSLSGRVVQLDAIHITGRSECRVRPDSAQEAFRAWEAVRTALTAAAITEGTQRPFEVRRVLLRQRFDVTGRKLLAEERSEGFGMSRRPFVAAPVEQLERLGYVVGGDTGKVYFAPDAETLISDSFADSHCLRLVGPPADTGVRARWVGVGFSPIERRKLPDVEGTLWLDATTSELREIEYHYVNIPLSQHGQGRVAFLRLPNGAWIVRDWGIRMPVLMPVRGNTTIPGQVAQPAFSRTGYELNGGNILEVRDRGTVLWAQVRVPLSVRVVQAGTDSGIPGAELRLEGEGRRVRTGADGRAKIDSVIPGTRRLLVRLGLYDSLGLGQQTVQVATGDSEVVVPVDLSERLLIPLCSGSDTAATSNALAYGVVLDAASGAPLPEATVRASWTTGYRPVPGGMLGMRAESRTTTDSKGRYLICGLPRSKPVAMQAEVPGVARSALVTLQMHNQWRANLDLSFRGAIAASEAGTDTVDFVRSAPAPGSRAATTRSAFAEFEWRRTRKFQGGTFFTREDIAKRGPARPLDLLRGIPSVILLDTLGTTMVVAVESQRLRVSSTSAGDRICVFTIALNGQVQDQSFSPDRIPVEMIEGMEVYRGMAQVPAEYATTRSGATCGLVGIWTSTR